MLFPFTYAIDACSFIKLRRDYPSDVFPGVWDKMKELSMNTICSVEEVYREIMVKDDELAGWINTIPHIFLEPNEEIQREVIKILKTHKNLINVRKDKSGADPFLIATAIVHNCTVVTEETPSRDNGIPKIPEVCRHYDIECIRILEMLRREGLKL